MQTHKVVLRGSSARRRAYPLFSLCFSGVRATEIEWSISNPAVAELKPAGSVAQEKALAEGSATLTAAVDGNSGSSRSAALRHAVPIKEH